MRNYDTQLVGWRIKELRNERAIGQNKLAADLQISNASISYWENGNQEPSASALFKLAQYFGVSAEYLLGLED
ncbi:MAG: helix-turn-helix domain-containing protein [Clostridiaceae bacterium]|jgi:transcriptional regulator with XRE-family HTH domain|nr:helix-turn-helix domain-containing protein [Clostridiaceae bacterium]